jgi:hypothetical protein
MEVNTGAIGSAARIGFEEFLDGRWQFSDFTSIILEQMDYFIYNEVAKALEAMIENIPDVNKAVVDGFDEQTMDELLAIIDTHGRAAIYCTQEFANQMIPSEQRMSDRMKDTLWRIRSRRKPVLLSSDTIKISTKTRLESLRRKN